MVRATVYLNWQSTHAKSLSSIDCNSNFTGASSSIFSNELRSATSRLEYKR